MNDGTLRTPSGERVVLEIKGRRGPIRVADARQLSDWVRALVYADDDSEPEQWKGLLIGNPHNELPPAERPEAFAPNCLRVAEQDGHALVTTNQRVDALASAQTEHFEQQKWWNYILQTSGAIDD